MFLFNLILRVSFTFLASQVAELLWWSLFPFWMTHETHNSVLWIRAGQWLIIANLWPLTAHIFHVIIIVTGDFSKKSFFIIIVFRTSHTQTSFKTFRNIHRKISVLESLFNKVADLVACNFISTLSWKKLKHRCFTVNITTFLWTTFFIEHLQWLLLSVDKVTI